MSTLRIRARRRPALTLPAAPLEQPAREPFPICQPTRHVQLVMADALQWMAERDECSVHAIVTDPPYGLVEFDEGQQAKLRDGKGGVWRIPPSFDGSQRAPLPRFTTLTAKDRERLTTFFQAFAFQAARILVPGGHIVMASNPLVSTTTFAAIETGGLEKRGELIRVVKTLRGGDRPKGSEDDYPDVSVMPRSCWEPWGIFRKPIDQDTVAANLKKWGTGGFRRISEDEPFRDLVEVSPARAPERELAPHPSIKPQKLMRYIVRGVLPLGKGIIYDPFAGSGSTLAAASHLGLKAIGTERDLTYYAMAERAIPRLAKLA